MSRIYFNSEAGRAEVLGSERAWLGSLSDQVGMSVLSGFSIRTMSEWLTLDLFGRTPASYKLNRELEDAARLALRCGDSSDRSLSYQGLNLSTWDITLNTALRLGSRPVQLATRMHAQCEIHGWVDGPNRAWFAETIEEGLSTGTLRKGVAEGRDPGWYGVINLMRSTDDAPVVMSYSVTDSFPNADTSTWVRPEGLDEDDAYEMWEEMSGAEQWRMGMDALRAGRDHLEFTPYDFDDYIFGHNGLTWLDIAAGEARLRDVLELDAAVTPTIVMQR